jgi:hypothetical protein
MSGKYDKKNGSFLSFPPKICILMVDIIILNPIGSFKVYVDRIFFVFRPIFYHKISLMQQCTKEKIGKTIQNKRRGLLPYSNGTCG